MKIKHTFTDWGSILNAVYQALPHTLPEFRCYRISHPISSQYLFEGETKFIKTQFYLTPQFGNWQKDFSFELQKRIIFIHLTFLFYAIVKTFIKLKFLSVISVGL